jgi:hypothetical protein
MPATAKMLRFLIFSGINAVVSGKSVIFAASEQSSWILCGYVMLKKRQKWVLEFGRTKPIVWTDYSHSLDGPNSKGG